MSFGKTRIAEYYIQKESEIVQIRSKINNRVKTKYSKKELLSIGYLLVLMRCIRTFREDTSGLLFDSLISHNDSQEIELLTTNAKILNIAKDAPNRSNLFKIKLYYGKRWQNKINILVPVALDFSCSVYNKDKPATDFISNSRVHFNSLISASGFFVELESIRTLKLFKEKIIDSLDEQTIKKLNTIEGYCLRTFKHYDTIKRSPHAPRKEINNREIRFSMRQFEMLISPLWDTFITGMSTTDVMKKSGEFIAKLLFEGQLKDTSSENNIKDYKNRISKIPEALQRFTNHVNRLNYDIKLINDDVFLQKMYDLQKEFAELTSSISFGQNPPAGYEEHNKLLIKAEKNYQKYNEIWTEAYNKNDYEKFSEANKYLLLASNIMSRVSELKPL